MIELTFLDFRERQFYEDPYCLYVIKNSNESVLYVGISTNDIWERWFGRGGHMVWDGDLIYSESPIGRKIAEHLPDSLKWKVQLWTLNDCLEFCKEELHANAPGVTIHDLEPVMIRKLSPALNGFHNVHPGKDATPKSKRQIERENTVDQVYKEVFNNEQRGHEELNNGTGNRSLPE
jgi:hypothetical protein